MTNEPDSDELTPEEQFANSYLYFIKAIETLAADADKQCAIMGNYNVAWEIKDNVSAGMFLLDIPGPLTEPERDGIARIVAALDQIPASVLEGATNAAENRRVMNDTCWAPLRRRAAELLVLLSSATRRNEAYLKK
ncbi:hypothetical protein [Burkholderia sp. PR2]|uniref:hypothetical protein n=1 Tax=Burkholderia sp. PR2 TaxID=3448078 RepID=UPI00402A8E0E